MNEISKHKKIKVLFLETVAMTSLGLVSTNNLKIVKADPISSKQLMTKATKKNLRKVSAVQPLENKNQPDETADQSISTNNNQDHANTNNSADANTPNPNHVEKNANKSDLSKINANEFYCMWNGLRLTYDTANDILTIPGSSTVIDSPGQLAGATFSSSPDSDAETVDASRAKKIKITGPLKFSGDLSDLFKSMSHLTEIEGLNYFDTSEVTEMISMFALCEQLKSVDLSSFDTNNVQDMNAMFANCYKLEELDLSKFKFGNLRSSDEMLQDLPELSLLVLGANASGYGERTNYNLLSHSGLETPGTWFKVGKGTDDEPEGLKQWNSYDLRENFRGETDADRYVRLAAVTVHYVDEKEKKVAADSTIKARRLSKKTIEPKVIPGYTLKTSPVNYRFIDGQQEITYVYYPTPSVPATPSEVSNVTVKYQDEEGNSLTSDEILTGKIGDGYVSQAKDIPGYSLKSRPANATGFFSGQAQTVIYVYSLLQPNKPSSEIPVIPNRPDKPNRVPNSDGSNNSTLSNAKSFLKIPGKKAPNILKGSLNKVSNNDRHKLNNFVGNSQDKKLPQTGINRRSQFIFITFGAVALFASLFSMSTKRKNKD